MTTKSKSHAKEIVENFVNSIIIGGKFEEISNYVDPNVITITCGGFGGKGLASATEALGLWSKSFKILENECLCSLSNDTHVIEQWRVKATHVGEFLNVPPSNKNVSFSGVSIYEIRNGKIISITGYSDFLIPK